MGALPVSQVIDFMNLCWSFQMALGQTTRAIKAKRSDLRGVGRYFDNQKEAIHG